MKDNAQETASGPAVTNEELFQFSRITGLPFIQLRRELSSDDNPVNNAALLNWCKKQKSIIALETGLILTSEPRNRRVQICRAKLAEIGIRGRLAAASQSLIDLLYEEIEQSVADDQQEDLSRAQQRLYQLVDSAVRLEVSDIHVEVRKTHTWIRFRRHGVLQEFDRWKSSHGRMLAAVAFNRETESATGHFNPLIPQDGSMELSLESGNIRLRLATAPVVEGFDLVMRILAKGEEITQSLEDLGYTAAQQALVNQSIHQPHGAVIVSGPTGSGKTTTLAAVLKLIEDNRKIYTIEDPVEKKIPNASQIPINTSLEEKGFAAMGKAALRLDPDVLMLGEIRDENTAQVMVRGALTGHLMLSTLHSNSAIAAVTRLADIGVSRVLLSDPNLIACVIYQRLMPLLCEHCKQPVQRDDPEWDYLPPDLPQHLPLFRHNPNGCDYCEGLGVQGRTVVAEVIHPDSTGRQYIADGRTQEWIKYMKGQGWHDVRDHAYSLVLEGRVDLYEAQKIVGQFGVEGPEGEYYQYPEHQEESGG